MNLIYLCIVSFCLFTSTKCISKIEKSELRDTVIDMFRHAYNSYMTYAYPADELMPLSCKGRFHDTKPSRGDVDDILGNFSMTLIDSLDSLAIFGEIEKFDQAVKLVIENVQFDNDIVVSVFETNIRVLGGLLGGHVSADVFKKAGTGMLWYKDELLVMAKDMGERLLPAFNTTTGIPYPRVNLRYGVADPRSRTGTESDTCTACAGTMIMEFGALSRLTGEPLFEAAAHKAMMALWGYRSRTSDLVGTVINIHNGEWVRRDSGVGAGIDSYYEYCLKAYILLGEEDYLQRFNQHYKAIMRYINKDSMFLNVHMHNPTRSSYSYMDSLQAFWPGLQVLKGDLKSAIELHELFYSVAKRHVFLPEAFTTNFEVHWGQHLLRPELIESTYFLYEATKDPYYLEVGKYIVENLNRYTRVPCGFAAVKDVRNLSHEDRMDSFLLSETLKYLYLLFTEKNDMVIDIHDFVFTTEAHILPLALSNWNGTSNQQKNHMQSEHLHDHSCPSTTNGGNLMSFANEIRRKSRSQKSASCPKPQQDKTAPVTSSTPPRLRAEQFIPGNTQHLHILKSMGISVSNTDDGKVQLMQNAGEADSTEMAAEGIKFMQSMIEIAKFRSDDAGVVHLPRVVQILSPPYNGHIVLNAGPAQFGVDLAIQKSGMGVIAKVIMADPIKACTPLNNRNDVNDKIVIMERGECMFIDKVRQAESCGAVGAIIIDNNVGSSSESQPMFAMSGDGTTGDIHIPAVFLFSNEGDILKKSMEIIKRNDQGYLKIRMADKATCQDLKKKESNSVDENPSVPDDVQEITTSQETPEKVTTAEKPAKSQDTLSIEKLMEVMQNVAKQPGFEFLNKDKKTSFKASSLGKSDSRDVWLRSLLSEEEKLQFILRQKAAEKADIDAFNEYHQHTVNQGCRKTSGQTSNNFKNIIGIKDKVVCGVLYDENSAESFIVISSQQTVDSDDGGQKCDGGETGDKVVGEEGNKDVQVTREDQDADSHHTGDDHHTGDEYSELSKEIQQHNGDEGGFVVIDETKVEIGNIGDDIDSKENSLNDELTTTVDDNYEIKTLGNLDNQHVEYGVNIPHDLKEESPAAQGISGDLKEGEENDQ